MHTKAAKQDCPTSDDLSRYLAGESASSGFDSLDDHIAMCARCQQSLESLGEKQNPISHLIADVVKSPPIQLAVSLQQSLERIRSRPNPENRAGEKSMDFENITLIRDYRILESIGEGGMGCVFRAVHTRLNRPVAIKVLRQDRVNSKEAVSRFSREMQLIAQLQHPNIVKALDAGEQDGLHYLVMEFLAGCDVGQLSKRLGPLPIADACQIIRLAATALQYAHDQKILHRDIKPSNLLLTPDGCVKLLDLGLAQFFDFSIEPSLSRADQAVGTLAYMAPEQLSRREEVTTRSDIFSLGVSLHELLTGQRPFERPGQSPLLAELSSIRPDVDESLSRLIGEMVSNASSKRPLSMQEIVNRLTPFVETADLCSLMTEYFRWSSRNPAAPLSKLAHAQMEHRTAVEERSAHETLGDRSLARQQETGGTEMHKNSKVSRFAWHYAIAATVFLGGLGIWWGMDPTTKKVYTPPPPPLAKGELEVTADGDVAMQLLDEGSVFATPKDTLKQESLSLRQGMNEIEPGTHTIKIEGPETFEPLDIRVERGAVRKLQLTTTLTKSFQFPTIPGEIGAYGAYHGFLRLKDWPKDKLVGFDIRLQVLSIENRGDTNLTCLKFETISHHPSGDFEETGYLNVDTEKWRQNLFEVVEGFVRARGPEISDWVQYNHPESKSQSIVVLFDKERDRLKEIAEDAMPPQRVSLQDYIALFFGDKSMPVANASIRELRSMLPKFGKPNSWLMPINGVSCYVVSSLKREDSSRKRDEAQDPDDYYYLMARRKAEPFGFVFLDANTPTINVRCTGTGTGSGPAKVDPNEYSNIAEEFKIFNDEKVGPTGKRFWDRAGIPEKNASTTWQGAISVAISPRQLVKATASSLGTETIDGIVCRWIEVEVSSTNDKAEDEHWEAARLLVDDNKYRETGKFEAKKGWLAFGNKETVFELPEGRDLSGIIDQRLMLSDSPHFRRFSVIDTLAMLFDAEFIPASKMSSLRKEIAGGKKGLAPTRKKIPIPLGSTRNVQGELWESPEGVDVNYRIQRTPEIAFDFYSVFLKQSNTMISLEIEKGGSQFGAIHPTLGTPLLLEQRRVATQLRVKEAIKPNWRVWSWSDQPSGTSFKAWAEFGGMLGSSTNNDRSKGEVLLRNRNGDEIRIPGNALSADDWNWARKGRIWASASIEFRETQMPLLDDRTKELDILYKPNKTRTMLYDRFNQEDQAHIERLRAARKTKSNPSEQLLKWGEFAPYIRK